MPHTHQKPQSPSIISTSSSLFTTEVAKTGALAAAVVHLIQVVNIVQELSLLLTSGNGAICAGVTTI